jgi:hypothetical protein
MMMMIMMNMSGMENHPTHIQSCLFPDIYFKGRSFLNFQFLPLFLSAENQQTPGFLNLLNRIFVISLANPTFGKSGNMKNLKIDQLTWRNQQKTHGTCEKHGHFVSRPRIFFLIAGSSCGAPGIDPERSEDNRIATRSGGNQPLQ